MKNIYIKYVIKKNIFFPVAGVMATSSHNVAPLLYINHWRSSKLSTQIRENSVSLSSGWGKKLSLRDISKKKRDRLKQKKEDFCWQTW